MTRKIIQIAAIPSGSTNTETLYALCDDGSVWFMELSEGVWVLLPSTPQEAEWPEDVKT